MNIQLKRQRSLRFQNIQDPLSLFYIKKGSQNTLSEYSNQKRKIERHVKHVNAYEKQILKRQELQNQRLLRKIMQIKNRRRTVQQIHDQKKQKDLLTLNQSFKKLERLRHQQTLQHQNDILVQRIVRMRRINSQLSKSQSKYKKNNKSVILPKIEENYNTQVTQS